MVSTRSTKMTASTPPPSPSTPPSPTKTLHLFILSCILPPILYFPNTPHSKTLLLSTLLSTIAGILTYLLIPGVAELTLAAELGGIDINKRGMEEEKKIPEALGIVPATMYIIAITVSSTIYCTNYKQLNDYSSALSTITFIVLLGFADDVLNLRWRYKMILPPIASISLLLAYSGSTYVVVPLPLQVYFGTLINLGLLYHLYMLLLTTFCSNAINILAGLNGLEVGQSLVISCSILLHNMIEMVILNEAGFGDLARSTHLFSATLILPFIGVCLALLAFNWFPSKVFVGDTFTYFAGVTFAVCAILGHFSKTLLLFFIPQTINFLYSLPQLIGIIHCPRHRLPRLNLKTGKLEGISSHMNLINVILLINGPLTEHELCLAVLIFQILCSVFGFFVRYYISSLIY